MTREKIGTIHDAYKMLAIGNEILKEELKGGNEMETKSRYEVISELESKKRDLIRERDSFDSRLKLKQLELKEIKRDIEDKEEEIKNFQESSEEQKETLKELIKSIDESLSRLSNLDRKK